MTDVQRLKRLYIILRWYDCVVAHSTKIPEQDFKLAMELEKEMHEIQKQIASKRKKKQ
jgi:hypothetical protein